jgi:hypothetical protein
MDGINEIEVQVVRQMAGMLPAEEITMSQSRRELLALSAERGS